MVKVIDKVNLSHPVNDVPKATTALVFYERDGIPSAVTEHRIVNERLRPGRVVSLDRVGDRLDELNGQQERKLLPESILLRDGDMFVWWTKPRLAPMWFRVGTAPISYNVRWPSLLWVYGRRERSLRVFGLGSSQRPTMKSPVYHAPLMNIGSRGHLCEGTAVLPSHGDEWSTEDIEACVFDSFFTHVNHDKTLKGRDGNKAHQAFWREKGKSKEAVWVKEMIRIGRVEDVIR